MNHDTKEPPVPLEESPLDTNEELKDLPRSYGKLSWINNRPSIPALEE